ncbi:MAG: GNAT family protein [Actinomycetota bacterium]|nr:GNAT family protein [Actinomycetota bacterium]
MNYRIGDFILRDPEPADIEALYHYKNDPAIAGTLGGFTSGYSLSDIQDWIEFHRKRDDEVVWVIAEAESDHCVGHIGFYRIDYRARSAEFAILIGDRALWGKGLGRACTAHMLTYGFNELNLNRVHLTFMASNEPARRLYLALGFKEEGVLRQAQYKNGAHVDLVVMGILREEYVG